MFYPSVHNGDAIMTIIKFSHDSRTCTHSDFWVHQILPT